MKEFLEKYGVYVVLAVAVVLGALWWTGDCSGGDVVANAVAPHSSTNATDSASVLKGVTEISAPANSGIGNTVPVGSDHE